MYMHHTYAVAVADTAACEGLLHSVLHSSSYIVNIFQSNEKTRVPKNTYPVLTEHAHQFELLHMQQIPRLVAGVLHCKRQFAYIEAVVAQELKHLLLV